MFSERDSLEDFLRHIVVSSERSLLRNETLSTGLSQLGEVCTRRNDGLGGILSHSREE